MTARAFFGACLLVTLTLRPTVAASQGASTRDQGENADEDFFKPPNSGSDDDLLQNYFQEQHHQRIDYQRHDRDVQIAP